MHKYAGVVLDYYDDRGATLKKLFPTQDDLPGVIKTANVANQSYLPNDKFALVMLDQGHVLRKYACVDPGTTAMSAVYFMEHGDKLPDAAQKLAATNITRSCLSYGLMPPAAMVKKGANGSVAASPPPVATDTAAGSGTTGAGGISGIGTAGLTNPTAGAGTGMGGPVDVTGASPTSMSKVSAPVRDEDYAVITRDGGRHYPIHTWDMVKSAERYFDEEQLRMDPGVRRQFAKNLTKKAHAMGYPLDADIVSLGAYSYHSDGHLKQAIEMRKIACPPGYAREFLDDLFEKRATVHPEVYAECLHRFDVDQGLDKGWDRVVPDPWFSTFGIDKTAEVVWEDGADRVTSEALENLAHNHMDVMLEEFTEDVAEEFKKDPKGIFNSMPTPHKRLIARMANDSSSYGASESYLVG